MKNERTTQANANILPVTLLIESPTPETRRLAIAMMLKILDDNKKDFNRYCFVSKDNSIITFEQALDILYEFVGDAFVSLSNYD